MILNDSKSICLFNYVVYLSVLFSMSYWIMYTIIRITFICRLCVFSITITVYSRTKKWNFSYLHQNKNERKFFWKFPVICHYFNVSVAHLTLITAHRSILLLSSTIAWWAGSVADPNWSTNGSKHAMLMCLWLRWN